MNKYSTNSEKQYDVLREQIQNSIEKTQAQKSTLKRKNSRYTTATIILSAVAALLAATAGTVGNTTSWKPICLLAAICSAGVTMTTKMQSVEQLTEASECLGQLKALRIETITPTYDMEQVSEKYQQILSTFSAIDC